MVGEMRKRNDNTSYGPSPVLAANLRSGAKSHERCMCVQSMSIQEVYGRAQVGLIGMGTKLNGLGLFVNYCFPIWLKATIAPQEMVPTSCALTGQSVT